GIAEQLRVDRLRQQDARTGMCDVSRLVIETQRCAQAPALDAYFPVQPGKRGVTGKGVVHLQSRLVDVTCLTAHDLRDQMQIMYRFHAQDGPQLAELRRDTVIGRTVEIIVAGVNKPLAGKGMPVPTARQMLRLQWRSAHEQQKSFNERLQWKAPARWRVHDDVQHIQLHQESG